jgi:hypothetical protein
MAATAEMMTQYLNIGKLQGVEVAQDYMNKNCVSFHVYVMVVEELTNRELTVTPVTGFVAGLSRPLNINYVKLVPNTRSENNQNYNKTSLGELPEGDNYKANHTEYLQLIDPTPNTLVLSGAVKYTGPAIDIFFLWWVPIFVGITVSRITFYVVNKLGRIKD